MPPSGGLFARLKSLFSKADPEEARRRWLLANGRIIEGTVIDLVQNGRSVVEKELETSTPCTILYRYHTFGVTYESAHELNSQQMNNIENYRVGKLVSVRYDPRRPANSLIE